VKIQCVDLIKTLPDDGHVRKTSKWKMSMHLRRKYTFIDNIFRLQEAEKQYYMESVSKSYKFY
jgi:hypothetical protein